ncbi:transglycosylase SLT domain-containing protein [Streptomyces sp. NPDC098789]|uniref:transglycosylase SLT domain-containing protein n=1 Tax=Streptomyces sp. NPDC098789 TaxID=3366098 RepID=UPI00380230F4
MFRTLIRPTTRTKTTAGALVALCAVGGVLTASPAQAAASVRPTAIVRMHPALPKARPAAAPDATPTTGGLNAWIDEALTVMARHGIPGSYAGVERNIMRESSGNRDAINETDSNAAAGTPSEGLLQIIAPTFYAYHVSGTSTDPYDPVANIVAACNYAAHRYGSIDNVTGAY